MKIIFCCFVSSKKLALTLFWNTFCYLFHFLSFHKWNNYSIRPFWFALRFYLLVTRIMDWWNFLLIGFILVVPFCTIKSYFIIISKNSWQCMWREYPQFCPFPYVNIKCWILFSFTSRSSPLPIISCWKIPKLLTKG